MVGLKKQDFFTKNKHPQKKTIVFCEYIEFYFQSQRNFSI